MGKDSRLSTIQQSLLQWLAEPVDSAGLHVFRFAFGVVAVIGAARFLTYDWVERLFARPVFHFRYLGFDWLPIPDADQIRVLFVVLLVLGLLIAFGLLLRITMAIYFLVFSYIELIDVTTYLNHYYLVSMLSLWMFFLPIGRGGPKRVGRWCYVVLQLQVTCVYTYAAIAKATPDWLLHGQPMEIWLASRTSVPFVGQAIRLFGLSTLAMIASWLGFLHDLAVAPFLAWKKSRAIAYVVLLGFHLGTHLLFNIGMFPIIMSVAATVFFDPAWPRRWQARWRAWRGTAVDGDAANGTARPARSLLPGRAVGAFLIALGAFQVLWPLRGFAYGGNILWHERGMRFSWRVMCREKNGSVEYRVLRPGTERAIRISPGRYLTGYQEREMATRPDMILQLAHQIGRDYAEGDAMPEVYVDAVASLNGRRAAPLIDPDVDLMTIRDEIIGDGSWILDAPAGAPADLR
ncbi:MAG: HTTM domain-containing protein [Myxococcota bacterium]